MSTGVHRGKVVFDTYLEGLVPSYRVAFGILVALQAILRVKEGANPNL
jgi:hypothetical protein